LRKRLLASSGLALVQKRSVVKVTGRSFAMKRRLGFAVATLYMTRTVRSMKWRRTSNNEVSSHAFTLGITALGVFAELSYSVYQKGLTLVKHMQSLYDKYGEFVSNNGYYFCYDPTVVTRIMREMQNDGKYMTSVGPYEVESIRDLWTPGYDSTTPDKRPTLPTSKSSPMMTICFTNGCVAQFRGSGTEPKFKYYIEMKGEPGVSRDVVTADLLKMCDVILEELLHPEANGLVMPK